MEESIVVQKDIVIQADRQKILDLEAMTTRLNTQVSQFRERVVFLEQMEKAQKKELEEHVDVLLKMEQERLIILKENQKMKQDKTELEVQNNNYEEKIS